jgi:hypothetical protein
MVIPIGGGNGGGGGLNVDMQGPPPAEMWPRFQKIKGALLVLILSVLMKIAAGAVLMPNNWGTYLGNSISGIFSMIIGIFLLKDDATFSPAYNCLVNTFCSNCREQCPGGMTCLCTWWFYCLLVSVLDLIPLNGSEIMYIIAFGTCISNPDACNGLHTAPYAPAGSSTWYVLCALFTVGMVGALLAKLIGGWVGLKAWQEMQTYSDGFQGGGHWAEEGRGQGQYQQQQQQQQQARDWGGGRLGGTSGMTDPIHPVSGGVQGSGQQGFHAFQGTGNRLGS